MTDTRLGDASKPTGLLSALREFIGALDRRPPRNERPDEVGITMDAQRLRREAVVRIEALIDAESGIDAYDRDLVESIMTDDGGRQPERAPDRPLRAGQRALSDVDRRS